MFVVSVILESRLGSMGLWLYSMVGFLEWMCCLMMEWRLDLLFF